MAEHLIALLMLALLLMPVWSFLLAPRIASLVFFNVSYLLKPNVYTLRGNLFVASLQTVIALSLIWISVAIPVYDTGVLGFIFPGPDDTHRVVPKHDYPHWVPAEDREYVASKPIFSNVGYYAVVGPLWFGLVLWPGMYLMSRYILVASAQYCLTEVVEVFLCLGSTWTVLAVVLGVAAYTEPDPTISRGLLFGVLVGLLLCTVVLTSEGALTTGFVNMIFNGFLFASVVPSRHGPGLFEPAGLAIFFLFAVPIFCMQVAIERRMIGPYLNRVIQALRPARKDHDPVELD